MTDHRQVMLIGAAERNWTNSASKLDGSCLQTLSQSDCSHYQSDYSWRTCANWSLTCAPFPLTPTQLGSTWFSFTIKCHLNVGGVVRTRQPKFPVTLFVWCKHDTTMKGIEAMVYLPLNRCYRYAVGHWTTMLVCVWAFPSLSGHLDTRLSRYLKKKRSIWYQALLPNGKPQDWVKPSRYKWKRG